MIIQEINYLLQRSGQQGMISCMNHIGVNIQGFDVQITGFYDRDKFQIIRDEAIEDIKDGNVCLRRTESRDLKGIQILW